MKVLEIGTSEMELIEKSLEYFQEVQEECIRKEEDKNTIKEMEYDRAHIKTTRVLLKRQGLQELCERCLSYFWDRLKEEGIDNPDVEWLSENMGIDEEELKGLFKEAGFEEE